MHVSLGSLNTTIKCKTFSAIDIISRLKKENYSVQFRLHRCKYTLIETFIWSWLNQGWLSSSRDYSTLFSR